MTEQNNLLSKVITSGQANAVSSGVLNPAQSDRFIDYFFDEVVLMPQVRQVRMKHRVEDIDKIGIGRRILRGATEAVDDGINIGVSFNKISLTSEKFRADMEISTEALEDNIEGDDLEDHIARMLGRQIGQDLEDLAVNGDMDSSDPLLHHLDGWGKRGLVDGSEVPWAEAYADADTNSDMTREFLGAMLKVLPRKFKSRRDLKFFAGSDLVQDYVATIGEAAANAHTFDPRAELGVDSRPGAAAGYEVNGLSGVRMQELPLLENREGETEDDAVGDVWLTFPKNLVWGTVRDIKVHTEFKPKADTTEYTVFTRVATALEEPDAFVVGTGVPIK